MAAGRVADHNDPVEIDVVEAAILAGVNATDWTWSPRFEDLDNDGDPDLAVACESSSTVDVLLEEPERLHTLDRGELRKDLD